MELLTKYKLLLLVGCMLIMTGCLSHSEKEKDVDQPKVKKEVVSKKTTVKGALIGEQEVPVLCYHAIRNSSKNDSSDHKIYSVSPLAFAQQMKALANEGYTTISPDALYNYLKSDKPLPQKPIMITFDDGREEQYSIGAQEMKKYNFRGVFFIMTVAVGKPGYMSSAEIKDLSDNGHTIGCHTWDHHKVNHYEEKDWQLQLVKPKKKLEEITQKPIAFFAYPYGLWNEAAADSLKANGYKMAFTINHKKNPGKPFYTIPRMIVPGSYSASDMLKAIKKLSGTP
jgi:peptidoglycan/xylan/chitin deacetylase (PgdA/CDA1 family)